MKLLVVDDDESMRDLLRIALKSKNFSKITTVASGAEALKEITEAQNPFDCFMLDVQMPEMDGIELCHRLRQMYLYNKTPILMITAMDGTNYIERAFAVGATDYITKPFDVIELLDRVGVAEQVIAETQNADEFRRSLGKMASLSARQQHLAFKYPARIEHVDRFISMLALRNFINRIPKLQSVRIGAYAFRVPEMWSVFHALSARDFYCFLSDLSAEFHQILSGMFEFASYSGSGVFLFVDIIENIPDIQKVETMVNKALKEIDLLRDLGGEHVGLSAHFGNVFSPSSFSPRGSFQFITNALESAHRRSRGERIATYGGALRVSSAS